MVAPFYLRCVIMKPGWIRMKTARKLNFGVSLKPFFVIFELTLIAETSAVFCTHIERSKY